MKAPAFLSNLTGRQLVAIVVAICAALGVTIGITTTGGTTTITITVQTPQGPTDITAPAAAVDQAARTFEDREHTDLNATPEKCPPGVTPATAAITTGTVCVTGAQLAAGVKQVTAQRDANPLPDLNPLASPSIPGCKTRFISRNYSSRNGVRPIIIVLHITVSPDNGQAGVNAITAYFNQSGPGVSSHLVTAGATAACNYIVPTSQKAWTQTGFNSRSISIEVTGTQTQGYYVKGAGRAQLVRELAALAKAWNIPLRRGAVSGCNVTRSGVVDHVQLGACGGGHNDINPYRATIPGLIADADKLLRGSATAGLTSKQVKWCRSLKILRAQFRDGRSTAERRVRARKLKELLGPSISRGCR